MEISPGGNVTLMSFLQFWKASALRVVSDELAANLTSTRRLRSLFCSEGISNQFDGIVRTPLIMLTSAIFTKVGFHAYTGIITRNACNTKLFTSGAIFNS